MRQVTNSSQPTIAVVAIIIALVAVAFAIGQYRTARMATYAAENRCTWQYNGTAYGDNRDYTCK